jgi:hypothetical protein
MGKWQNKVDGRPSSETQYGKIHEVLAHIPFCTKHESEQRAQKKGKGNFSSFSMVISFMVAES